MRLKSNYGKITAVLFALLLWQLAATVIDSSIVLAGPVGILKRLPGICREPDFLMTVWSSLRHIAGGFLLAFVSGVCLASLAGRYRWIETALWPLLVTVKTVPVASFVVICLMWLSSEQLPVFISFLIVLPVIYGNTLEGIKSTDSAMLELAQVFDMPLIKKVLYIRLPQLKPFLMSACRTALGMAWKAGVAAEIIGTPEGSLGKRLYLAKIYLDTDDLFCWTLVIVIVSVIFEKLFMLLLKSAYRRLETE